MDVGIVVALATPLERDLIPIRGKVGHDSYPRNAVNCMTRAGS